MAEINVEYIDHLGDDLRVVNAARCSFSKESSWDWIDLEEWRELKIGEVRDGANRLRQIKEADAKLIRYLAKHRHEMPFAHCQITVRVKAPVPIARQAFKSKVGFVESEESRRYIKSTPEVYIPDEFRSAPEGSIKQGSGGRHPDSDLWKDAYIEVMDRCRAVYERAIEDGVCPEQARFILPQGAMVNWVWTGSLLAFSRFYRLRADSHAQKEIQVLADQIDRIVRPLFPCAWGALVDG